MIATSCWSVKTASGKPVDAGPLVEVGVAAAGVGVPPDEVEPGVPPPDEHPARANKMTTAQTSH
ncbi:hypothetical protein [Arthrobacter humicola]